jgi:hypothetical protein
MEFGAVLGDAVHNIRTAFDYTAVIISSPPYGSAKQTKVYFPTGKDRQAFVKELRAKMQGASRDAQLLVEALEPFSGGKNSSIRGLHDLDNGDKHRMIIPALSLLHMDEWGFNIDGKPFTLTGADFQPNADRSNFIAVVDCQGLDSEKLSCGEQFNPNFKIVFAEDHPLNGLPIIETLLSVCDVAKDFIHECEQRFKLAF